MTTIPDSYNCCITQQLMRDPVQSPRGHSYEKAAIEDWISRNGTSPMTRDTLTKTDLRPNLALKDGIDSLLKSNPELLINKDSKEQVMKKRSPANLVSNILFEKGKLLVSHQVEYSNEEAAPCDITACIDVSGSMGGEASLKNTSGISENTGLSYLDVVKHAVKTMIATMSKDDRICLISYNHQATTQLEFTNMDSSGKLQANTQLDRLTPGGQTNIMDGLNSSLEAIRTSGRNDCNSAIILFTDGIPNIVPPRGHGPTLQRYLDRYPEVMTQIHTCGFGYNLDSELLTEITKFTNSTYSFIPDSSMVGTIMVNLLSNIKAVGVNNLKVSIEFDPSTKIANLDRQVNDINITSWGVEINIGSIGYGQKRDFIVVLDKLVGDTLVSTTYRDHGSNDLNKLEKEIPARNLHITLAEKEKLNFNEQITRITLVNSIHKILNYSKIGDFSEAKMVIKNIQDFIESKKTSPYLEDVKRDIDGQITQSITREDWFKKWGIHYLPSLAKAHELQLTNNFKDPGVQHYGGSLFCDIRDEADEIFVKLPAPKPSIPVSRYGSSNYTPVNMSNYHNSSGPCFSGHCPVMMADGSTKKVEQITKGDIVCCGPSAGCQSSNVICVLKTIINSPKTNLVLLESGLLVTPWHPIRISNNTEWQFPAEIAEIESFSCKAVYSFLLESGHTMIISDIECICLAHGFRDNEVVRHEYFGTRKVSDDLQHLPGWDSGLVTITPDFIKRDIESRRVNEISQLGLV